ncbi:MAG: hypothetical protein A2138_22030 [Deltaproteobacteria bacterium RBG_16_71_12]|nr:MAG: hypothetical protein A2138_22030 [Deltaproteobacteria bacterium RBG_16_71_12]
MAFRVRASLLQDLVAAAAQEPLLAAHANTLVDVLASGDRWLPGAIYLDWQEEALRIVGAPALQELRRRSVVFTSRGPALRAFVALARTWAAGRPSSLLRWYAPGQRMLLRGFADMSFEERDFGGVVTMTALCPEAAAAVAWRAGTAGVLNGILDAFGYQGAVSTQLAPAATAEFRIHVA